MNPVVALVLWIAALWRTGNVWAQWAIVALAGWFVALVGVAIIPLPWFPTILMVLPLFVAVLFLWLFFGQPRVVAIATLAAGLPWTRPTVAGIIRGLASLLAAQLTIGIYFVTVPVWRDRGLVPLFIAAVVVYALYAFLGGVSINYRRAMGILMAGILVITAIFFLGGRGEVQKRLATPSAPPVSQPAMEEFRCQAGEEVLTVLVGPGSFHRIQANKLWVAVVRSAGAEYPMPAGFSSWQGGPPEGLLRVRCTKDGTVLRFQKVR